VLKNPGTVDPNPPHGERGNFRKISVSLPPWIYERLIRESARRKIDGERNQLISELIREAVNQYLDRLDSCTTNGDFE
jgi:transcriptional regulator of met regulon